MKEKSNVLAVTNLKERDSPSSFYQATQEHCPFFVLAHFLRFSFRSLAIDRTIVATIIVSFFEERDEIVTEKFHSLFEDIKVPRGGFIRRTSRKSDISNFANFFGL